MLMTVRFRLRGAPEFGTGKERSEVMHQRCPRLVEHVQATDEREAIVAAHDALRGLVGALSERDELRRDAIALLVLTTLRLGRDLGLEAAQWPL